MARFVLDGRIAVRFLTSVPSDTAAPTQAELGAGVDLVGTSQAEELEGISGFEVQSNSIATPGYASKEVGNVPGDQTYPTSSMSFYKDDTVTTIYDALADDESGWVCIMQDGQASGEEVDIFPVTVASRVRRPGRNAANIFDVNFSVGVPFKGGTQAA